ncbi:hypothetical protein [Nonomuraea solani]|uniref:hypothetical protein n=1 Tax=Nonomuraea solani TaxID=1144553 RepID=UPI0011B02D69|nr:hypothetical protein [Nonomuraea solani]
MLLSLVYRLVKGLFGLLTVRVCSDLSKDVELLVLCHENQVGGSPRSVDTVNLFHPQAAWAMRWF